VEELTDRRVRLSKNMIDADVATDCNVSHITSTNLLVKNAFWAHLVVKYDSKIYQIVYVSLYISSI